MTRPSLVRVLTLAIAGVAVVAVLVTAGLTLALLRLSGQEATLVELQRDATTLAKLSRVRGDVRPPRPVGPRRFFDASDAHFVSENCGLTSSNSGELSELQEPKGRASIGGRDVLYASVPANIGGCSGQLFVLRDIAETTGIPAQTAERLLIAALVALGISAVVGYVLARRLSRPLAELASAARGLARGRDVQMVSSPRDPAEVAELREEFESMARHLNESDERDRAFLLSVSHELRTPLTAIRGWGEGLMDGTVRDQKSAGEIVVGESRRLERLVGDLIDLGRMESGEFSIELEEADPASIARGVTDSLSVMSYETGVSLKLRVHSSELVVTDPDRVHQMLANLVENALRVTPAGGSVVVTVDGSRMTVTDNGPGLEPDDLPHAFDRFYLWTKYKGRREVGSGLGLAIVGHLASLLDIDVSVKSPSAGGTAFTLKF